MEIPRSGQINNTAELLSPGGSMESIRAAVNAGADAVYAAGTRFGARAYANNPGREQLLDAIDFCHMHGVRLYMTVNTLFKERELEEELCDFLEPFYERGVDAVLVQDMGAAALIRERFPGLPLHASTQMSVQSPDGARLAAAMGITRIVPARELSLEEIRQIYGQTGMEIECFIHGALCYSYSGQCLMSSLIGGRSGNRGRCAQPCRKQYRLLDGAGRVLSGKGSRFLLNLKDLCALDLIPDLIEAGVASFKIEGRMKSELYTAGVTSVYRKYIDLYRTAGREGFHVDPADRELLFELFQKRGYAKGYYFVRNSPAMMAAQMEPDSLHTVSPGTRDRITESFLTGEKKESVTGRFVLREGRNAALEVQCRDRSFRAEAAAPQPARNRAVTRQEAERQLNKTGDTPFVFEKLYTDMGENLFIPMGELNNLRRSALRGLEKAILEGYARPGIPAEPGQDPARTAPQAARPPKEDSAAPGGSRSARARFPALTAAVSTGEQLEAVLGARSVSRVYLDCVSFMDEAAASAYARAGAGKGKEGAKGADEAEEKERARIREAILRTRQAGKECFLALPRTWRAHVRKAFRALFTKEILEMADGLLLRCQDQIAAMGQAETACKLAADDTIYVWNKRALRVLAGQGITQAAMPAELTGRELEEVFAGQEGPAMELNVYGFQVSMVTAQCLRKNNLGCDHKPSCLYLEDERHARFAVRNRCGACSNEILNSAVLDLGEQTREALRCGAALWRLSFTTENGAQTRAVLEKWESPDGTGGLPKERAQGQGTSGTGSFTRGHFRRGVE